ncbi:MULTISPECIES: cold shock and DUF1294 domain-containing protein [Ramlibacter]|uniref:cold shock and DUF1294 domain-containing protein n=1 Tax=Ramlibacter TaxID=174951 RepID=UPI00308468C0
MSAGPRFTGRLKAWHDDRGYGFIEPAQGGQEIFVHVSAFAPRVGRPQQGEVLTFEVEPGPRGKKRAKRVEVVRQPARARARRDSPAAWGTATLFAIPAFAALVLAVAVLWKPPAGVAVVYLVASGVAFVAYALDKAAARRGDSRTPEATLHLLALVGGWPGALLAQQFLRHKSVKAGFRAAFWGTVLLNVAAFVALCSPFARRLWPFH